jgi:tetratricopeptide (TPR) repeat protein
MFAGMFARAALLALLGVLATGPIGAAQPGAGLAPPAGMPAIAATPQGGSVAPGLPVPPVPPRIAQGPDYDHCLAMLYDDPQGASTFADSWASSGGGDGATHCQALAQIELGNVETGAEMLETLADTAKAPDLARASVFGQAVQAWMMANKPDRAFDAATLALALSPNDADLLIDRAVAEGNIERYRDAIDDLDRALAIDPRRAEAFVLRASAWRHLNNLSVAASDIEHALAINPDSAEALLERGILRQLAGNRDGAREDWKRAMTLDPDSTTADLAEQDLALLDAGPNQ